MSPDGSMILATGHTEEGYPVTGDRYAFSASGVYAISPATLEIERLTDGGEWETAIEFGSDGSLAYLTNWSTASGLTTINVLDLETLEIVGSRSGVQLEIHGPASVISEWDGGRP